MVIKKKRTYIFYLITIFDHYYIHIVQWFAKMPMFEQFELTLKCIWKKI